MPRSETFTLQLFYVPNNDYHRKKNNNNNDDDDDDNNNNNNNNNNINPQILINCSVFVRVRK